MEIFDCNNLLSYKVATRLKIPWICKVFYLVATLLNGCKHLVTILKWLMYLCKDYMASTLQKLVMPIFGYYNLSISLLKHFIKVPPHMHLIACFCHEDFNVPSHGIRNIKIRYIFYLMTFYHVRFCSCLMLCLYLSISLRSKWGLFQTLKEHYLMHESIRNLIVSAIGI